jgi:membrane protease YdiL (CAAX protease family)
MNNTKTYFFRNFWADKFSFSPLLGMIFFIISMIARYLLVINASVTGSSKWLPFIFIMMMIIPVLLLNREGRVKIGLTRPRAMSWILYAFVAGIAACVLIYLINILLFQKSLENALIYISRSYDGTKSMITEANKTTYFTIYAVIAMTVSPLGEEIFFRGFIHENFASKWGENHASDADSLAFSITHLIHFGIVYISGQWTIYFAAGIVWLASMYVVSKLFFYCRKQSGSVYGAVAAHSGFNFAMTWLIFYMI